MDRSALKAVLDSEDVDASAYSLTGGMPFEAYVLECNPAGWSVFYSERGQRSGEVAFQTEEEACAHLLELILRDSTTRKGR